MADQSSGTGFRVAIFGAGPAGFYAAEGLLKSENPQVSVDLFDRLPTPYGLVRGGVAPDHQKIKTVIKIYQRTAARPRFRFFGNVSFGEDLSLAEVLAHYDQVLFTTGSETVRRLGIPGEDLPGSYPATAFVGWYNGHPDYASLSFPLNGAKRVAVVGNGNVAVDVTRVLARPVDDLAKTDIADYALEALRHSTVEEVIMLGRRGPAQAAFTNPEVRELNELGDCDLVVRPEDVDLDELSEAYLAQEKNPAFRRNVEILQAAAAEGPTGQKRRIVLRFLVSPVEILGTDKVEGVRIEHNELYAAEGGTPRPRGTGRTEDLPIDMIFRSIGYKGVGLPDVPFDERAGTIPNVEGRVTDPATKEALPRLYVGGWIKRGPSGVIGTNKGDALESAAHMLEDLGAAKPVGVGEDAVPALLRGKGVSFVSFADWERLDAAEVARGEAQGRPRVKFTTVEEMLAALEG